MHINAKGLAEKVLNHQRERLNGVEYKPNYHIINLTDGQPDAKAFCDSVQNTAKAVGLVSYIGKPSEMRPDATTEMVVERLGAWKDAYAPDSIVLALPLPDRIDRARVFAAIPAHRDVECLAPVNRGQLSEKNIPVFPPAAMAVICTLQSWGCLRGSEPILIVGQGKVGEALALLLSRRQPILAGRLHPEFEKIPVSRCPIIWADWNSYGLEEMVRVSPTIVSLTCAPGLIKPEWLNPEIRYKMLSLGGGIAEDGVWRPDIHKDCGRAGVLERRVGSLTAAITVANCIR